MSLSFDAKLTLDVSAFLASAKTAEDAMANLQSKIAAVNNAKAAPSPSNIPARQAEADAINKQTNALQEQDKAHSANLRNLARERYALYDVAAAYKSIERIGVNAIKAVVNAGAEYERAFANVVRTSDNFLQTSVKIGEAAKVMKSDLMRLAEQIPVTFKDIAEIATIGNQLGIQSGKIKDFTKVVSQFASTTDVTVNNAALSFGRIGQLLDENNFEKLGSSIAFAGVQAVATEAQILSVTKEIATTAKMVNFTTPEVVGLATALASLGIAPEAARGSIIRSFALINKAITEGGSKLDGYAKIAGMSAREFSTTWKDQGQVAFGAFVKGLQGLSDSGKNLDSVLRELGVKNVRDIQTIQKLGDNYDVYAQSIENANKAYDKGTFLSESYAIIQDTIASKLQKIENQWNNFLATLSDGAVGAAVKVVLDFVSKLLSELNNIAKNPATQWVVIFAGALTALVTAIAAVNAVVAISRATMLAYATAMIAEVVPATEAAGDAALVTSGKVSVLTVAMKALQVAGKAALWAGALFLAIEGVKALGDAWQYVNNNVDYWSRKGDTALGGYSGLQEALTADYTAQIDKLGSDAAVNAAIVSGALTGVTVDVESNSEQFKNAQKSSEGYATILTGSVVNAAGQASAAIQKQNIILGDNYDSWVRSKIASSDAFKGYSTNTNLMNLLKQVGYSFNNANEAAKKGEPALKEYFDSLIVKAIKLKGVFSVGQLEQFFGTMKEALLGASNEAALLGYNLDTVTDSASSATDAVEEIPKKFIDATKTLDKPRTIWNYIDEINSKMATAFDWQFGSQDLSDSLTKQWMSITKTFDDAAKATQKLRNELLALEASRNVLQYQLSIAIKYGDTKRADVLRAKLAEENQKIADKNSEISTNVEANSKSLTGNSQAAIDNREKLQNLTQSTLTWITSLKTAGYTTEQLIEETKKGRQSFIDQAIALGFSADELGKYTGMFDAYIKVLESTPDTLDLKMSVYAEFGPADAALHKWKQDNKDLTVTVKVLNPDWSDPTKNPLMMAARTSIQNVIGLRDTAEAELEAGIESRTLSPKRRRELQALVKSYNSKITSMKAQYKTDYGVRYATGGMVYGSGGSTSDDVPAMLSTGEFVMNAASVRAYGADFMNAINGQKLAFASYQPQQSAASGSADSSIVYLSPDDRALLRAAIDRPINLYTENTRIAQSANAGNVILARRGTN